MTQHIRPLRLKNTVLPHNVLYAPLAGCSDFPFRKMSAKYHPALMYCEMVKMDALVRYDPHTLHILDYSADMHPIGAQLCGSKLELAGQSARMIEDLGFDVLDLNCGCPVDKVTKDGSGSGMLKNPELIGEIIAKMVATVRIPVTVKIRAGWDDDSICAVEITKIVEQAGAQAICIHGRTREQGYKGAANWDYIKACKDVAQEIKVIGNGDAMDPDSAKRMFEHTGCDAILVARGTMGAPWVVEDIIRMLSGQDPLIRTLEDRRQALLEHVHHVLDYHGEKKAVVDVRRIGCWYLKKSNGTRQFREYVSRVESSEKALELIQTFHLEEDTQEKEDEETADCAC